MLELGVQERGAPGCSPGSTVGPPTVHLHPPQEGNRLEKDWGFKAPCTPEVGPQTLEPSTQRQRVGDPHTWCWM